MTKSTFCKIPANLILHYGKKIPFDVFLKLSDTKVVKIGHKTDDIIGTFNKYQKKGVAAIYASKKDYLNFLEQIKDDLQSDKFFSAAPKEQQVQILSDTYESIKESFQKIGINATSIELAQECVDKAVIIIQEHPSVYNFFKKFKNDCNHEFLKSVMVSYTSTCMLDHFNWHSKAIKEKASLAAILRDILLTKQDFDELMEFSTNGDPASLSQTIVDHPIKTAEFLSKGNYNKWIAPEVLTIIEQHHELPNGTGFPRKINHLRITPLASVHIVASHFIHQSMLEDFKAESKAKVLYNVEQKLAHGDFKKTINALYKTLKIA